MTSVPHSGAKSVTPGGSVAGGAGHDAALKEAESRGVGIGMAIAAAIVAPDDDVKAAEILHAIGLTTKAELRRAGVDGYDIEKLSFTLKCIADRAKATAGETRNAEPIHRRDGDEG